MGGFVGCRILRITTTTTQQMRQRWGGRVWGSINGRGGSGRSGRGDGVGGTVSLEGGEEAAGGVGGCPLTSGGRVVLLIRPQHRLATPTQQVQHSVVVLGHHHQQ